MFERYTEKARRVIFFARYEASQFGSPVIDTEHLLLGLAREDKRAYSWVPQARPPDVIRQRIESWIPRKPPISTAVDLPLSEACKHVLHRAKHEADRLISRSIGTEHLFLALLQEPDCPAAKLLLELGADLDRLRVEFSQQTEESPSFTEDVKKQISRLAVETITIHGAQRTLRSVLELVIWFRQQKWHWHRRSWTPQDAVVERTTGKISLDLGLSEDHANFEVVKGGWKKDHCVVCRWELFKSADDHGTGYTNGRDWLCLECYDKFWARPDFISGSYSDIT